MERTLQFTLAFLIAPILLSAKGDTIRITITGGDLAAPIEITDPVIAGRFPERYRRRVESVKNFLVASAGV